MKSIINDVNKIVRKSLNRTHPAMADIMINWGSIVGGKFGKISHPVKITTEYENKKKINTLHIRADNSSVSVELSFQQGIIIERIAIYLGYKAINKIRIIV
ncbi:MAG: DUF721 domain-containing protein [Rickettsiaceae bacterium]|nr:DUF721 domain-containing protein [Rickettsiaceae bacterium]